MSIQRFIYVCLALIVLSSCAKHASKTVGSYRGTLEVNDSIVSQNAVIDITEISKKIAEVSCDAFDSYQVEIDKKRYFASVSYFTPQEGEQLEIYEDGTITLLHYDASRDKYVFYGQRN